MSFASLLTHSLEVWHPTFDENDTDERGQPAVEYTRTAEVRGLVQPRKLAEAQLLSQAGVVVADHVIFMAPIALAERDRIDRIVGGRTGVVRDRRDPAVRVRQRSPSRSRRQALHRGQLAPRRGGGLVSAPRLIRRDGDSTTEYRQPVVAEPEAEEEPQRPTSRMVRFEVPDGFMATVSLVPYTEPPPAPEEAAT